MGENSRMRWLLLAGAGGAIGALGRAGIAEIVPHSAGEFPWATLLVNVIGCLAIGAAARRLSPLGDAWRFAVTGVIGGFTTFSTFANEVRGLFDENEQVLALVYVTVTVAAGLVCVDLGFRGAPGLWPPGRGRR